MLIANSQPPVIAVVEIERREGVSSSEQVSNPDAPSTCGPEPTFEADETGTVGMVQQSLLPAKIEFDWSDERTNKQFTRLEAKFLAGRTDADESENYILMKKSRREVIFASTYMQDYLETERLKSLSKHLGEIKRYLKPIGL